MVPFLFVGTCSKMSCKRKSVVLLNMAFPKGQLLDHYYFLWTCRSSLDIAKTEYKIIGTGQRLAAQDVNKIKCTCCKRVLQICKIARPNYDSLTWEDHTNAICKTISSGTATLKRVRRCICKDTAEKMYQSLIEPYISTIAALQFEMVSAVSWEAN